VSERHSELRVLRWHDRITDILAGKVRGPIRANLDLTNLCSHACPFCEPVDFRKATITDKRHTLDRHKAEEVLVDLAALDCRSVQFSGGGEPTLHPEFGRILGLAHVLKMRTFVITHGGYLGKWKDELLAGADHIRVSLDSSCDREHKQAHGSKDGEFRRVTEGVDEILKFRHGSSPEVGLAYIVQDANSSPESLHRFLKLATDLGVDYVQFRPVSEQTAALLTQDWEVLADRINDLRVNFPWLEIFVTGQRWRDVFTQREFTACFASLTLAVISATGEVCACCDQRDLVFGNIYDKPFREIWLSVEHREKARKIVPRFCGRCVQCGTNRGIQRFVIENEALPEIL